MKMKKIVQGTAVAALAAAAWMGAGSTDASAYVTVEDVSFNAGYIENVFHGNLFVYTFGDQPELMVNYPKIANDKVKITSQDVYENEDGYYNIDLSKLKTTKDNYIALKQDDMDAPIILKIEAGAKKMKATFDGAKAVIDSVEVDGQTISDADKMYDANIHDAATDPYSEDYISDVVEKYWPESEYEKPYEERKYSYRKRSYKDLQYQGGTRYIYAGSENKLYKLKDDKKGYNEENFETDKDGNYIYAETKDLSDANKNVTTTYTMYTLAKMPGKVAKVTIAKQANASAVTSDYAKGIVTLKKDMEWRVVYKGEDDAYEFQTVKSYDAKNPSKISESVSYGAVQETVTDNKKAYDLSDLFTEKEAIAAKEGYLEVRKIAKTDGDAKKHKCASKWNRVKIELPKTLDEAKIGTASVAKSGITTDGSIVATGAAANTSGTAVIEVKFDLNSKKAAYTTLTFKNKTTKAFDIVFGDAKKPDASLKVNAKLKNTVDASVKIKKDLVNGKTIWIRVAGDKKDSIWAGAYTNVGTVTFPSDPK